MAEQTDIRSAGPHIRLIQPSSFDAPDATKTCYVRLGSYAEGGRYAEKEIAPNVTATRSAVSVTGGQDPSVAPRGKKPLKPVVSVSYTPLNKNPIGVLMYSEGDMSQKVQGACLQEIGAGHAVAVTDGDSSYWVEKGAVNLGARNGVFIAAGVSDVSRPSFTSGKSTGPANIEMVASGYIKQTAMGDFHWVSHGDTKKEIWGKDEKVVVGYSSSEVRGDRISETKGDVTTYIAGSQTSTVMGLSKSHFFGERINTIVGFTQEFCLASRLSLNLGWRMNVRLGTDTTVCAGNVSKVCLGGDFKVVATDDSKIVGLVDFKNVGVNSTYAQVSISKNKFEKGSAEYKVAESLIESHSSRVDARASKYKCIMPDLMLVQ